MKAKTAGFVRGVFNQIHHALEQGFEELDVRSAVDEPVSAADLVEDARRWVGED